MFRRRHGFTLDGFSEAYSNQNQTSQGTAAVGAGGVAGPRIPVGCHEIVEKVLPGHPVGILYVMGRTSPGRWPKYKPPLR